MLAMGAPQAVVVTMRTGVEPRAMVSSGCGGESAAFGLGYLTAALRASNRLVANL